MMNIQEMSTTQLWTVMNRGLKFSMLFDRVQPELSAKFDWSPAMEAEDELIRRGELPSTEELCMEAFNEE